MWWGGGGGGGGGKIVNIAEIRIHAKYAFYSSEE